MATVFVSYASADREVAERLVRKLREQPEPLDIFLDRPIDSETASMPSGAYWLPYLGQRLRKANAVVALMTREYVTNDACWLEMSAASVMDKMLPLKVDPGLPRARITDIAPQKDIPTLDPAWLSGGAKEPVNIANTAVFDKFVVALKAACARHRPFEAWAAADASQCPALAAQLQKLLQRRFVRTGLAWSPGQLAKAEQRRFFAAVGQLTWAQNDSAWDLARRKALKALVAEPLSPRVRAEALMGLLGELMSPSDGGQPASDPAAWEFLGDLALPIDRDISRFAYTKAGAIPDEVRDIFQVLKPRKKRRTAVLLLGGIGVGGGLVGLAAGYLLHPAPASAARPCEGDACRAPTPSASPEQKLSPASAPVATPPATPAARPTSVDAPAPARQFEVSAHGLEWSVQDWIRTSADPIVRWTDVVAAIIANDPSLCEGPLLGLAAETGNPLDYIRADHQPRIAWPSAADIAAAKGRPPLCPPGATQLRWRFKEG